MRPKDGDLGEKLNAELIAFDLNVNKLPGIRAKENRGAFVEQLIESIRRVEYVSVIGKRDISVLRTDPSSELFDPLRAAISHHRKGRIDEAFWLVFHFVHFGKSRRTGWRLARDIYGSMGGKNHWDWTSTSTNPKGFRRWLKAHQSDLQGADGVSRSFGNHRKYESLDASSANGTGAVVESYVNWINPPRTHQVLIQDARKKVGANPRVLFDFLYSSMNVDRFGRTARFDYLTMVGKLGLARIEPGSTYLKNATGPLIGARLLFGASAAPVAKLESSLAQLESRLDLKFGMQVLEDALCNWQKSPAIFVAFRG